jgi:hypothetical protein
VIEKLLIKYAKWEAKERLKKEKPSIAKLIIAPTKIFIYRYILMMGFLDGVGGFIAANLWAMYTFLTYLYMLQWQEKK